MRILEGVVQAARCRVQVQGMVRGLRLPARGLPSKGTTESKQCSRDLALVVQLPTSRCEHGCKSPTWVNFAKYHTFTNFHVS